MHPPLHSLHSLQIAGEWYSVAQLAKGEGNRWTSAKIHIQQVDDDNFEVHANSALLVEHLFYLCFIDD